MPEDSAIRLECLKLAVELAVARPAIWTTDADPFPVLTEAEQFCRWVTTRERPDTPLATFGGNIYAGSNAK